jgi:1,2-dihydroxy-3-keto-5-methylthiopentene dioxygenase
MVRAWKMDESVADQRLPHMTDPPQFLDLKQLADLGVEYYKIDADNYKECSVLQDLRKEKGYDYEDQVKLWEGVPDYDNMIKKFFVEHIHADDEIRLVLDGSGYFDVRDSADKWVRVEMVKGDMIVLPAGIYHRFTLDTKNYIIANRYFIGSPVWTPLNRPVDDHPIRQQYVEKHTSKVTQG